MSNAWPVNGVDVFRVFDALNDPRNFMVPMKAVKKSGKHAQAAISYTVSPVHTVESYVQLAKELAGMGADSICIKDMASLLSPYTAYELVKAIKKVVDLPLQIHSHSTTGMSVATLVKAAEAGAEMIDTSISSMSMEAGALADGNHGRDIQGHRVRNGPRYGCPARDLRLFPRCRASQVCTVRELLCRRRYAHSQGGDPRRHAVESGRSVAPAEILPPHGRSAEGKRPGLQGLRLPATR